MAAPLGVMNKFQLVTPFVAKGDQPAAIDSIVEGFNQKRKWQTLLGATGTGKTFTMANIIQRLGKKTLILAPNKTLAGQLFAEFRQFFPHNAVEYFVSYYDYYRPEAYVPSTDTYIEKDSAINDEIDKLRHSATRSLLDREDVIVVASVSCIYGLGSPEEYENRRLTFFVGDEVEDRQTLLMQLVANQYQRNDVDLVRGTFRVRGEEIDLFPAYEESSIIRLQFFDSTLEAIQLLDPLTGKLKESLNRITIYPASHYVVGEARLKVALQTIRAELRERLQEFEAQGKLLEKQRLESRTLMDLEMLEEMGVCSGIENYSRHLTGGLPGEPPPTLIDFFKKDFLLLVDESHVSLPQVGGMYKGDRVRKMNLVQHGFRLPSALDNRPLQFDEFLARLDQVLFVSATPGDYEMKMVQGEVVEQIIRPTGLLDPIVEYRQAKDQVENMLGEVKKTIKAGFRVLITTLTKKLAEELTEYYRHQGIKVSYLHSEVQTVERMEILRDLRQGVFDVLVGINLLREGIDLPEVALVGIMDADKEGFLRSTRSLIQTIGRAARNSEGRVILYGYKITGSMQEAMDETARRRKVQSEYNLEHGWTPETVKKEVAGGIIEILRGASGSGKKGGGKAKSEKLDLNKMTPQQIDDKILAMKKEMKQLARELKFEEAAKLRDLVQKLNEYKLTYGSEQD